MKKKIAIFAATGVLAVASLSIFLLANSEPTKANAQFTIDPKITQEMGKTVKTFDLVAKETKWMLNDEKEVNAWTFNGVVPGSQIRAQQGDIIRVNLKNQLKDLTSIHWHGYPVPNKMDGIPGMTQNAVKPGESFTYEFEATVPGTYWYHSHQDSANQVDKGLYGTLVVESKEEQGLNRDYTLVLDEWNASSSGEMDHSNMNMGGMDHSKMNMGNGNSSSNHSMSGMDMNLPPGAMHDQMMQSMYTTFSVNGKSANSIEPLEMAKGEKVRLRFANAGFQNHVMHLHGQDYAIVSVDGQKINSPQTIKDQPFSIAPGERYDIEFVVNNEVNWFIESHDQSEAAKGMKIPMKVKGAKTDVTPSMTNDNVVDMSLYGGKEKGKFDLGMKYDIQYKMILSEKQGKEAGEAVFTINGKSFSDIPPLQVKKGDKVMVTFTNEGSSNHPMHLHGHFFQVLSKNGKPLTGASLMKDTLNVKPGETYVVAFEADNPGDWMFHCHDLHHAAAGMVNSVTYEGYKPFVPDPTVGNKAH